MTPGQRLARVQQDGHTAISRIYAPLAAAVAESVMRRATPDERGVLRLSLPARFAILTDVGRLIDQARVPVLDAVITAVRAAREAAQADVEPVPLPFGEEFEVIGTTYRALGTDRASVISQTGALLLRGIGAGMPARQVAQMVREYFSKRDPQTGLVQFWPGRANMASQHARLVMLTETTAAHGRTMRRIAVRDGLGLKWHLSPQHQETDACNDNAERDSGFGPGVYEARDFPAIPNHARCRCWAETVELRAR